MSNNEVSTIQHYGEGQNDNRQTDKSNSTFGIERKKRERKKRKERNMNEERIHQTAKKVESKKHVCLFCSFISLFQAC